MTKIEIPMKLPSLNEYITACNKHRMAGARFKKDVENDIGWYINRMPEFKKPVRMHFHWIEGNEKRDIDNIMSAKKFILDAMVKCGKLIDDKPKYVQWISDSFEYSDEWRVVIEISEVEQ